MWQSMLRLELLTVLGFLIIVGLYVAQDATLRHRTTSSDGKTASLKRLEYSSIDQNLSSPVPSLPRSHLDHHDNKAKQRLHLNSEFSGKNKVVEWDEMENDAAAESGKRRQAKMDERISLEWTPRTTVASRLASMRRRRWAEALHRRSSPYEPQWTRMNRVDDDTPKKPRTRQRRSHTKNKPLKALNKNHARSRTSRKSKSTAAQTAGRSKSRSRKRWTAAAARDNDHEKRKLKRRLNRRQMTSGIGSTEEGYDDVSYDDDDVEEERGIDEESVEKRASDEVMISKAVLDAMTQRIAARVKDFVDNNTQKQPSAASGGKTGNSTASAKELIKYNRL